MSCTYVLAGVKPIADKIGYRLARVLLFYSISYTGKTKLINRRRCMHFYCQSQLASRNKSRTSIRSATCKWKLGAWRVTGDTFVRNGNGIFSAAY